MARRRLNKQGINYMLGFTSKSKELCKTNFFAKTSLLSYRSLLVLGDSLKDISIMNNSPFTFEFGQTKVPHEIGLPLLKLAKPSSISVKHARDKSTNELLEICDNVIHLDLSYPFNIDLFLRLEPSLRTLNVTNKAIGTVSAYRGLKLNKLVIDLEWRYSNVDRCVLGLLQVKSKSSEFKAMRISLNDVVELMMRNKQSAYPLVNTEVRSLKLTMSNYWPQEFITFFNVFHETFPSLSDFKVHLYDTGRYFFVNTVDFIIMLEHLASIRDVLEEKLRDWDVTFKLTGDMSIEVADMKKDVESFEQSIKNLKIFTVFKDKNVEDKLSVSLSTNQFSFSFTVSFELEDEEYDDNEY